MSSLREIDRDLDQIAVDAARLAEVQGAVRATLTLAQVDDELAALAAGARTSGALAIPRRTASPIEAEPSDDGPPSGQIDVPDEMLKGSHLPAVLALPDDPPAPLSLDLDSDLDRDLAGDPAGDPGGELGGDLGGDLGGSEESDLAPVPTSASHVLSIEMQAPPTETRALEDTGADDPANDLAALLGESDPMREGAAPIAPTEIEPEPTTMFSAEDAARYSRPAPSMDDEEAEAGDVELDIDEMLEIEEEPAAAAPARPKTQPPPPPRTAPPPPPARSEAPPPKGFLGKLLQRKP